MTREIKFRAWDTVGKQWLWITGFETAETTVSDGYTLDGLFHDGDYVGKEGIILMQYTGLKDKNGKQIYEGDVWLPLGCETPRVIVWHRYGWWFRYPGGGVTRPLEWTEDGEIIGNIYENPELLKGEETA